MERFRGTYVGENWVPRNESSKIQLLEQLQAMIYEMRRIKWMPESHMVCSVDGGPIWDERLPQYGVTTGH
jgi:hypothetical protein